MRLNRIEDPRDNLERADRDQLYRFAIERGVKEINEQMYMGGEAAVRMRYILRARGFTNINVPYHQLGTPPQTASEQPSGKPAVMMDELIKQGLKEFLAEPEKPKPIEPAKPVAEMPMYELRKACKAKGIKMERTDNLRTLREKLSGQQTAT